MHIFSLVKPDEHFDQLNHAERCVLLVRRHYFSFVQRGKNRAAGNNNSQTLPRRRTTYQSWKAGVWLSCSRIIKKKREEVQTDKYDLCARWGTSWKFSHPLYRILINHTLHQWGRWCVCVGGLWLAICLRRATTDRETFPPCVWTTHKLKATVATAASHLSPVTLVRREPGPRLWPDLSADDTSSPSLAPCLITAMHEEGRGRRGPGTSLCKAFLSWENQRLRLLCHIILPNMWKNIYGTSTAYPLIRFYHSRRVSSKFLKLSPRNEGWATHLNISLIYCSALWRGETFFLFFPFSEWLLHSVFFFLMIVYHLIQCLLHDICVWC